MVMKKLSSLALAGIALVLASSAPVLSAPHAERGAPAHSRSRENGAGFFADIREAALAAWIVDQQIPLEKRIGLPSLFFAQRYRPMGQKQIEPAIVVEVEPTHPEAGVRKRQRVYAGLQGHVREASVAVILKQ